MKVGDSFKLQLVSSAQTDSRGRYSLTVPGVEALKPVVDGTGTINVDIIVTDEGGARTMSSTSLSQQLGWAAKKGGQGAPAGLRESEAVAVPPMTLGRLGDTTAEVEAREGRSVPRPPQGFDKSCGTTYIQDLGARSALIGAHYDTTSAVRHDWEFNAGASTTLGVGLSYTNVAGSWRASGTSTSSSSMTIGWPESTGLQHVYTNYAWGKYRVRCYDGGNLTSTYYQARVRTLAGGASTWSPASAPAVAKCLYQVKNSIVSKTTTKQTTHATGADTSGAIGIDLSTQSGYTTSSKVTFRFDEGRNLCGTKDWPAAAYTSGLLVARL